MKKLIVSFIIGVLFSTAYTSARPSKTSTILLTKEKLQGTWVNKADSTKLTFYGDSLLFEDNIEGIDAKYDIIGNTVRYATDIDKLYNQAESFTVFKISRNKISVIFEDDYKAEFKRKKNK